MKRFFALSKSCVFVTKQRLAGDTTRGGLFSSTFGGVMAINIMYQGTVSLLWLGFTGNGRISNAENK
jgi:hypothetical protein